MAGTELKRIHVLIHLTTLIVATEIILFIYDLKLSSSNPVKSPMNPRLCTAATRNFWLHTYVDCRIKAPLDITYFCVAMLEHSEQNQVGRKRFTRLTEHTVHHPEKPGQELKVGARNRKHGGKPFPGLLALACLPWLAPFLYSSDPPAHGGSALWVGLSQINQQSWKHPIDIPTGQSGWGNSSNEIPSSQITLTKTKTHLFLISTKTTANKSSASKLLEVHSICSPSSSQMAYCTYQKERVPIVSLSFWPIYK